MDPTLDAEPTAVERGEDVRPIPSEPPVAPNGAVLVPDLDALVCRSIGPMCLATVHEDPSICRPDDACWTYGFHHGPGPNLEHVSHGGPCWHEVGENSEIQVILPDTNGPGDVEDTLPVVLDVLDDAPGEKFEAHPSPPSTLVELHPGSEDPFIRLRDDLYVKLVDEGNGEQLSIVLATIYAAIVPSQIPETMSMLRSVGDSISGVLGDGGGGIMGKLLGRAMKGNG